jgi:SAM-dependent methyltransferase
MKKEDLLAIADSYRKAKILFAANEYDLFTHLSRGPLTAVELAELTEADPRGLELLLNALVSLGFLEKEKGAYSNTEISEEFLVRDRPGFLGDWLRHANKRYAKWKDLERAIFKRPPGEEDRERFLRALDNIAKERAEELASRIELHGKRLLDVGGGSGAYSVALCKRFGLEATIIEYPDTAKATRKILREKKAEGIRVIEGDFLSDPLGEDYDAALVSNIVHFQSVEENRLLLERVYDALAEGGRIVVHDYILDEDMTSPQLATIFSLHMLMSSEEGRSYSWSEIEGWLKEAGFKNFKKYELKDSRVIVGEK